MDKQEIIDYVQFTPENTNPAILSNMLDKFSSGPPRYQFHLNGRISIIKTKMDPGAH